MERTVARLPQIEFARGRRAREDARSVARGAVPRRVRTSVGPRRQWSLQRALNTCNASGSMPRHEAICSSPSHPSKLARHTKMLIRNIFLYRSAFPSIDPRNFTPKIPDRAGLVADASTPDKSSAMTARFPMERADIWRAILHSFSFFAYAVLATSKHRLHCTIGRGR